MTELHDEGDLVTTDTFSMDCPTCGPETVQFLDGEMVPHGCDYRPPSLAIGCTAPPELPRRVAMRSLMDDVPAGGAEGAVDAGHPAGDCMRACVASILDLDLTEVPHFVQYINHPAGTDELLWWWALRGFCHAQGWRVEWTDDRPPGWAMTSGKSPRGHSHVVVSFAGEIVHDPHPSAGGLVSEDGWFTFEQVPELRGMRG